VLLGDRNSLRLIGEKVTNPQRESCPDMVFTEIQDVVVVDTVIDTLFLRFKGH
jgi:K+-sensing histidine kinase KdpD